MLLKEDKARKAKGISGHTLPEHPALTDMHTLNPFTMMKEELKRAHSEIQCLKDELSKACERRFAEGHRAGEKVGYKQGLAAIETRIHELAAILEKFSQKQGDVVQSAQQFVVDFCFRILAKLTGAEAFARMAITEERLRQVTDHALNELSESSRYVIRVHTGMAETLTAYKTELTGKFTRDVTVVFVADPSLRPGDCLIESDYGVLDARIESQLSELKDIFSGV
jgi:flagellar assembly protein FliH